MYRNILTANGTNHGYATTLGNILTADTIWVIAKDVNWVSQVGYLYGQSCQTSSNREFGLFRGTDVVAFWLGGAQINMFSTAQSIIDSFGSSTITGDLRLDVDITNESYVLYHNGVSVKSASFSKGANRIDGVLFMMGARASSDTPGETGGAYLLASGDKVGEIEVYLDGLLERHYVFTPGSTTVDDIESSEDMTLANSTGINSSIVTPENNLNILGVI